MENSQQENQPAKKINKYWPLIVVVLISLIGGWGISLGRMKMGWMPTMIGFMGLFFLFLSSFKFWDLKGFSEGFAMYDLLAKKQKAYGFIYPFLELLIAFGFLSARLLPITAGFTILLMAFSAAGVFKAVKEGLDVRCACMGTKLDLPLSTVTIVENLGMGIMSIWVLIYSF
jgi:hypothetical protein